MAPLIGLLGVFVGFTLVAGFGYGIYHIVFEWMKVDWLEIAGAILLGALCATGVLLGVLIIYVALE